MKLSSRAIYVPALLLFGCQVTELVTELQTKPVTELMAMSRMTQTTKPYQFFDSAKNQNSEKKSSDYLVLHISLKTLRII